MILDIMKDTVIDTVKLLPFLFFTYMIMEYIEHSTEKQTKGIIKKSGKYGPVLGSVLGIIPQCGFSAAASNLYAGRVITLGTLLSIFLSTSDEMLPILISKQAGFELIFKILGIKVIIAMFAGFIIDYVLRSSKKEEKESLRIEHMCSHKNCHCGEGNILKSSLVHTAQIMFFILLFSFIMNLLIGLMGEDKLSALLSGKPILGPVLAGVIGLIPNCASSVLLTQLYLEGLLSAGSMIAGLLVGAGVGLLVLFRVNDNVKENIKITLLLYFIGSFAGIIIETAGLVI